MVIIYGPGVQKKINILPCSDEFGHFFGAWERTITQKLKVSGQDIQVWIEWMGLFTWSITALDHSRVAINPSVAFFPSLRRQSGILTSSGPNWSRFCSIRFSIPARDVLRMRIKNKKAEDRGEAVYGCLYYQGRTAGSGTEVKKYKSSWSKWGCRSGQEWRKMIFSCQRSILNISLLLFSYYATPTSFGSEASSERDLLHGGSFLTCIFFLISIVGVRWPHLGYARLVNLI